MRKNALDPFRHLFCLIVSAALGFEVSLYSQAQTPAPKTTDRPLLGFSRSSAEAERALEAKFDAVLDKENLRNWMKRMAAHPHHVGSPHGKEVADFIAAQFQAWGFDVQIEQFDILFPTPKSLSLEMTAPESFQANLQEPPVDGDATSSLTDEALPTYNAYSIDGDVTGQVVYVNYGVPKDYEVLADQGIDVRGKIVLARYGGSWRGIKPKVAAEHGAVACLIYSDPREDGYFEGDVYPDGPWRNARGAQRGSAADIPVYPGDPLTPGVGATKDAKRLPLKEAATLTRIPVLPIAWTNALPLLRALRGPVAPEGWRGALPITYHLGPGPATAHLHVEFNWNTVPAYDVIARMNGSERPDEWVIRGNHHDAWVFGAEDPLSGTVALLEEARALGLLAKQGWKPKRTVILAAWDAEEPGLIGSTEWAESHAAELREHAVAYLNSDNNARGFLRVGGCSTLQTFINQIAADVVDPEKKISIAERLRAQTLTTGNTEERRQAQSGPPVRVRALGSGSDYSSFLQHLGITSLDIRFGGEGEGGSYHSLYDSYDHFSRFIDPTFEYGRALAQTAGRAVLRLANADLLPFEFGEFAETVGRYVTEVTKLADDTREETKELNRLIADKTLEFASDPALVFIQPKPKDPVPYLNFAPLQNAAEHLRENAGRLQEQLTRAARLDYPFPAESEIRLEMLFMKTERLLTREEGLPRRPWYKHMIYAPGFYTGYGVKTLPGVREAIEERQWSDVNDQIEIGGRVLERFADELAQAERIVRSALH
jgi:N-acetylated-alpha-linked acidic dipeptidase